ncbi:PqiC family protein [Catenovulum sp. SX2]|uniref:PqiC family protein n=1 Tax=Catenovulum sp. SX2 TaxID=3398614 RepID=UPI003F84B96A
MLPIPTKAENQANSAALATESKVTIVLAPFLQKENLVVMQDDARVYFAHYHRWAQPLEYMLKQTFVQQLKLLNKSANVTIQFDKLHGSTAGLVTLQGIFVIDQQIKQPFLIEIKQAEEGYPAMLDAMTQGLLSLAENIASAM